MLTGDLIRVRIQGRAIAPSLVPPDQPRLLERAQDLLALFEQAADQGWTRAQIDQACKKIEGTGTDHKLTRGLAKVLLDKCEFDTEAPVEPARVRELVFQHAAQTRPIARQAGPAGRRTAQDVFTEVAARLTAENEDDTVITADDLRRSLYADLKEEQRVIRRSGPQTPRALLDRYNVALVQALLLRSTGLELHLRQPDPKRVRQLLRYLKFHELMFRAWQQPGVGPDPRPDLRLQLDGPQSLLTRSTRYGMQLARFFPALLLQPGHWQASAEVLWGHKRKMRKQLTLDSDLGLVGHYRDTGAWRSRFEQWFEERFTQADHGWSLAPGFLIDLGDQRVIVPDFSFRKGGRIAHLDIVGYWRKKYLRQRIHDTPPNVVLAVSKRLAGEKAALPQTLQRQIVSFAEIIPVAGVVERLEAVALPEGS